MFDFESLSKTITSLIKSIILKIWQQNFQERSTK